MRQVLIAGNWKMNGSRSSIRELLEGVKAGVGEVKSAELAVCAPFPYLADVQDQLSGSAISWGAQNLSTEEKGAFTGETSAAMLLDFSCKYVTVGHSERRSLYGEDDALVAQKFAVARKAGLKPILCVGETLEERESNVTEDVVARQIDALIALEGIEALVDGVIAYEPVWAIGTGKTASPEQAQAVHAFIRAKIAELDAAVADKVQILYGGSMNPGNAAELLAMADIDGGLIGGASLKADDFIAIGKAAG
ncbi:Triosephosphate isomerase [hydrothermal vent metagenome]|uniref:triose-phosphate isomerase n=1 Tax=hydrothermal vent metagenome TaxID=652676 RepID=A0A3B1AJ85_9ZZZZ